MASVMNEWRMIDSNFKEALPELVGVTSTTVKKILLTYFRLGTMNSIVVEVVHPTRLDNILLEYLDQHSFGSDAKYIKCKISCLSPDGVVNPDGGDQDDPPKFKAKFGMLKSTPVH